MTRYYVTVDEAELAIVEAAVGHKLTTRKAPERNAAKAPKVFSHGKPPKLTDKQRVSVARDWAAAVEDPEKWRVELQYRAAQDTNRQWQDVEAAWGIAS